jgi:hypothetical protein
MNKQCLFCATWTTSACCQRCQDMSRAKMFTYLLSLLGKAASAHDYYDQIKLLCHQIGTVGFISIDENLYSIHFQLKWLLAPVQFDPITYFDPAAHKIDFSAKMYLLKADSDVRDMIPVDVLADGNCLYNSIECLAGTTSMTPSELRGIYHLTNINNFHCDF